MTRTKGLATRHVLLAHLDRDGLRRVRVGVVGRVLVGRLQDQGRLRRGTQSPTCTRRARCEEIRAQHMPRAIVGECFPDTEITETPSTCMWNLWRSDVVGMPKSLKTVFRTKQECEQARDAADRTLAKRGETSFTCNELDTSTEQERRPPVWLLRRTPPFEVVQSLIGTFKTREQCQQRRGADIMKSEERKLTYCFPDTGDPRGPKGR